MVLSLHPTSRINGDDFLKLCLHIVRDTHWLHLGYPHLLFIRVATHSTITHSCGYAHDIYMQLTATLRVRPYRDSVLTSTRRPPSPHEDKSNKIEHTNQCGNGRSCVISNENGIILYQFNDTTNSTDQAPNSSQQQNTGHKQRQKKRVNDSGLNENEDIKPMLST